MKYVYVLFGILFVVYMTVKSNLNQRSNEKPIFLKIDTIANNHETYIDICIESNYLPDSSELEILIKDYSNIWAHLNHLYTSNDILSGKEYYTENWFKQINNHYDNNIKPDININRKDVYHDLHIKNWSSDALVCTAIDSSIILSHMNPNGKYYSTTCNIAVVLLYQGDHWRIEAMKFLN